LKYARSDKFPMIPRNNTTFLVLFLIFIFIKELPIEKLKIIEIKISGR
jgi:hypothetical protein